MKTTKMLAILVLVLSLTVCPANGTLTLPYHGVTSTDGKAFWVSNAYPGAGLTYGGFFYAAGTDGRGVFGQSDGSSGMGVKGWAKDSGDVENYGGHFTSAGERGIGVYGWAENTGDVQNYGGFFLAEGNRGIGLFAMGGLEGLAGEFAGDIMITGTGNGIIFPDGTKQTTAGGGGGGGGGDADFDWVMLEDNMYAGVSGNVGIGTTNPEAKLEVAGRIRSTAPRPWAGQAYTEIEGNGINSFGIFLGETIEGALLLNDTSSGDVLLTQGGGSVGIGTTSPVNKLDVEGGMAVGATYSGTNTAPTNGMIIEGNVGIGNPSPDAKLSVVTAEPGGRALVGYSQDGCGVRGWSHAGTGVSGGSSFGPAGEFFGTVSIYGELSKSSGSFKIDHPLDPENRCLKHSFVESPDMMNIYNGNVTLDENGQAIVQLPEYFEALNFDFRYQLTAIGAPGPNLYIAEKISENCFKIAGGKSDMEVSWQVTGIRQDPYAVANRIEVEVEKPAEERGYYLHPKAYGLPEEKGIETVRNPRSSQTQEVAKEKPGDNAIDAPVNPGPT